MTVERKVFALDKATISDNGTIAGYAAVFGNVDDGGDVIEKGFFAPVLDEFLKEGFVSWGHDWQTPVAMPTVAREDDTGLYTEAQFHSTPRAQEARQIAAERLGSGKTMGLSIGYETDTEVWDNEAGIRHLVTAKRLFEYGIVTVPMNRLAGAVGVKDGMPYSTQGDQLLNDLRAFVVRSKEIARPRKEGRVLSSANRSRLESLLESLAAAAGDITDLLASTDPDTDKALARAAEVEYLYQLAVTDGLLPDLAH